MSGSIAQPGEVTDMWSPRDWLALVGVTALAGVLRFIDLADPDALVFDELYYAKDSCWYAFGSLERCDLDSVPTEVHPPLGKWLIAAAIRIWGFDSFGWRVMPAIAGTISVALLFLLARKIFRSTVAATVSSGVLALCLLHLVQSRVSMLDIFVPTFGIAAFLFTVFDRDTTFQQSEVDPRDRLAGAFRRPWRLAAGLAGGAAAASKWSGILVLVGIVVLTVAWTFGTVRRRKGWRDGAAAVAAELPAIVFFFLAVPAVVYFVTYIGRLDGEVLALPWSEGSWWSRWWDHHTYMYGFHAHLEANHTYQSPAWSWLLLKRPVSYFFCSGADCDPAIAAGGYKEILATGNPFVWWTSVIALGALFVAWVRSRDPRGPEGLILAGFAFTYLPWPLLTLDRSAVFLFYLLASVPFMALAIGWVTTRIGDSWEARTAIGLFIAGTISTFWFYSPLVLARPIPEPEWRDRIWIFDNCDAPRSENNTTTITTVEDGTTTTSVSEASDGDLPPEGWCWI